MSAAPVVEARGLHVNAGDHVLLRDLNLSVAAGEQIGRAHV